MRVEANRLSSTTLDWDLRPLKHQVPLVSKDFCQAFQVVTKAPSFTSIFGAKMQMIFHKGSFSTKDCVLGCENPQTLQAHLGLSNLGFDHWGVNFLS